MSDTKNAVSVLPTRKVMVPVKNELGEGISGSFARIKLNGKTFGTVYGKQEQIIPSKHAADEAAASIECVIVAASKSISKMYYEGAYARGAGKKPDCFSDDGDRPDPRSEKPQAQSCLNCQYNKFNTALKSDGSPGGAGKRCRDTKRIAIVPYPDVENALMNGPMLLRVMPTAFKALRDYGAHLATLGYPANEVVTKIGFFPNVDHQQFTFTETKELSDAEKAIVQAMIGTEATNRVLGASQLDEIETVEAEVVSPLKPRTPIAIPADAPVTAPVAKEEPPIEVAAATSKLDAQLDALL